MVIGVIWEPKPAAYYRAIYPLRLLEARGHEIVWPPGENGLQPFEALVRCDVVHVYRRSDAQTHKTLERVRQRGIPIVWDNDDDLSEIPKESPQYKEAGGLNAQGKHRLTVKSAARAHTVVTTSQVLAEKYGRSGIEPIEVIPNYVPGKPRRPRRRHSGIVIGWIAALEHRAEVKRLRLASAFRQLLEDHPEVHVECIGADLNLPERYRHDLHVDFQHLPSRMASFDVGIAPLADMPFNHSRSDVKLREYAASGVPWLASPIGPYAHLGESHGGRLVADDEWYEALVEMVSDRRARKRLARSAKAWAKRERLEKEVHRWEVVFSAAASEKGRDYRRIAS